MAVPESRPCLSQPGELADAPKTAEQQPRRKLVGREFYESIGSPKYIVAPMVDRSEFAWRMLTRSFIPSDDPRPVLSYSPMFHARLFREQPNVRAQHFQPTRAALGGQDERPFLDGNPAMDRPLFVQFCANDPDDLLEAARHVAPYCDAVDLNLGCPQGIARKGHYGAYLQEDWDLIYRLINRLHKELSIPVTAKFRRLETKEKTLEYAKMLLSAGASILTLHGRLREQKGHNTGLADWSYIRYLRDHLPPDTVIFANGNNLNHDDLERCLEATGADGVMSAEGNLSDPTIFSRPPPVGAEGREYWRGRNGKGGYRMDAVFRRYLDIVYKYVLEQPVPERKPLYLPSDPVEETEEQVTADAAIRNNGTAENGLAENGEEDGPPRKKQKRDKSKRPNSPSLVVMQGHLFQLLRPMITEHTNVRDALARTRPGDLASFEHVLSLVEQATKEGLQEYKQHPERFEAPSDVDTLTGSKATIAEYGRPWWVCQPRVRPLPEEAIENGAMRPKNQEAVKANGSSVPGETPKLNIPLKAEGANTRLTESTTASAAATPDRLVSG